MNSELTMSSVLMRGLILATAGLLALSAHAETLLQIDYGWRTDGQIACNTPAFVEGSPARRAACIDPIAQLEDFAQAMDT